MPGSKQRDTNAGGSVRKEMVKHCWPATTHCRLVVSKTQEVRADLNAWQAGISDNTQTNKQASHKKARIMHHTL